MAACFGATSDFPGGLMTCRFLGMILEIWGQSEEPALLTDWGSHSSKAVVLGSVEKHSRAAETSRAVGRGPGEAVGVRRVVGPALEQTVLDLLFENAPPPFPFLSSPWLSSPPHILHT